MNIKDTRAASLTEEAGTNQSREAFENVEKWCEERMYKHVQIKAIRAPCKLQ